MLKLHTEIRKDVSILFFARIVFHVDEHHKFRNLSDTRTNIFASGDSVCTARIDTRGNMNEVILEYGGFLTRDAADEAGRQLVRNIKMQMIEHEIPINISGGLGVLDSTNSVLSTGVITDYGKAVIRAGLFGKRIPDNIAIEDDYIGLRVFEVQDSMKEIQFIGQDVELIVNTDFSINYCAYPYWTGQMDASLSLLTASVSVNDIRIKFLLCLMSIEALAPDSEPQDAGLVAAVDSLLPKVDELDLSHEQKETLKSKLGGMKEKNIAPKARGLLQTYLSGKEYNGLSVSKFFNQCYKMRSSFVHSGSLGKGDIDLICRDLKRMCIDLLTAISNPGC